MNPVRLIVLALVVWLTVLLLRRLLRPTLPKQSSQNTAQGEHKDYAQMVRCQYCGLHIPKASAYVHDQHYFCNEDHFRLEQDRS